MSPGDPPVHIKDCIAVSDGPVVRTSMATVFVSHISVDGDRWEARMNVNGPGGMIMVGRAPTFAGAMAMLVAAANRVGWPPDEGH